MKKAFTISLAFLLLLLSVRDLVTFAAFKFQQETIADKLCVNKYEPIPMCAGQCFLDDQIEENHEQSSDPFASSQVDVAEKVVYFQSEITPTFIFSTASDKDVLFRYQEYSGTALLSGIFHPPRFSA